MMALPRVEMSDHNSKLKPPVTSQPFTPETPLTSGEILEDINQQWSLAVGCVTSLSRHGSEG
jgi:hypothetical protein